MKIMVLGAGVVGVTTAYYLRKAGHEVAVVDRQSAPAMETSHANGGQIAAAHADPWASPETPLKILKWMGRKDAPLLYHPFRFDPKLWAWGLSFLANCRAQRTDINTERTLRIALYSRECLKVLRTELGLEYDHLEKGILHFYRDPKEFDLAIKAAETMRKYGLDRQVITPDEAVKLEPALSHIKDQIVGAIYSKDDESGDAFKFTRALAKKCEEMGVDFFFDNTIENIKVIENKACGVITDKARFGCDAVVVCLGSYSPKIVREFGIKLPIYPAKGYSITLPLTHPEKAPQVSLTDDEHKLVISRYKDRLRVAGTAEFNGFNTDLDKDRTKFILDKTLEMFGDCADLNEVDYWTGFRPKTPDSVPIIGKTDIDSLFLNTGHGTLGWTMACGSGQIISDIISENTPSVSLSGIGLDRF